ncbi:hypothetical protein K491DRAFT_711823 [Lophiostoma macrostomum CBS 122681]|uniref:Uncharacterized protein n=1 Tax=Lophiostoma macrostomum CBS 122681 TaxID=1314788 RepID=A0A6A6TLW5_9PLEO|nr:hypothetical protein K491DRAFT_711823 [Lophiostoma macrostomum CBS 122681]
MGRLCVGPGADADDEDAVGCSSVACAISRAHVGGSSASGRADAAETPECRTETTKPGVGTGAVESTPRSSGAEPATSLSAAAARPAQFPDQDAQPRGCLSAEQQAVRAGARDRRPGLPGGCVHRAMGNRVGGETHGNAIDYCCSIAHTVRGGGQASRDSSYMYYSTGRGLLSTTISIPNIASTAPSSGVPLRPISSTGLLLAAQARDSPPQSCSDKYAGDALAAAPLSSCF